MSRAVLQTIATVLVLAASLFLAAGTVRWPMAWAFLGAFIGFCVLSFATLSRSLLEERSHLLSQAAPGDAVRATLFGLVLYPGVLVASGLDRRLGWSPTLPGWLDWLGLAGFVAGYGFAFWAVYVNHFFSAAVRIQADRGHRLVDRGPYAWIRHPGYAGAIFAHTLLPLAFGSLVGVLVAVVGDVLIAARAVAEERVLEAGLTGYVEYAARVRWRLLPGVW